MSSLRPPGKRATVPSQLACMFILGSILVAPILLSNVTSFETDHIAHEKSFELECAEVVNSLTNRWGKYSREEFGECLWHLCPSFY